jgi:hypothetical protein
MSVSQLAAMFEAQHTEWTAQQILDACSQYYQQQQRANMSGYNPNAMYSATFAGGGMGYSQGT